MEKDLSYPMVYGILIAVVILVTYVANKVRAPSKKASLDKVEKWVVWGIAITALIAAFAML